MITILSLHKLHSWSILTCQLDLKRLPQLVGLVQLCNRYVHCQMKETTNKLDGFAAYTSKSITEVNSGKEGWGVRLLICISVKRKNCDVPSILIYMFNGCMHVLHKLNCASHGTVLNMERVCLWNIEQGACPWSTI